MASCLAYILSSNRSDVRPRRCALDYTLFYVVRSEAGIIRASPICLIGKFDCDMRNDVNFSVIQKNTNIVLLHYCMLLP